MIAVIFEFTPAPGRFVSLSFWRDDGHGKRGEAPADSLAAYG